MKQLLCLLLLLLSRLSVAQDSLQVMMYNLYRFPSHTPANREYLLRNILRDARPDLFLACEIINRDGAGRILNTAFQELPDSFAAARFEYCPTATGDPLQQMAYYNTRKLSLVRQKAWHTTVRDINQYTFYLNQNLPTEDTLFLDAFVTHLKSGTGSLNRHLRKTMADTFIRALSSVPPAHYVLLAGDFNFYDHHEPAYQRLLETDNAIVMVDPADKPGDWHGNPAFQYLHTQSTRETVDGFGLGGAGGGMDDRFDFIFLSQNLIADSLLSYLPGSYQAYGNNGNCLNMAINNDTCTGKYPPELRNLLFQMSDHVPVMMTLTAHHPFPKPATLPPPQPADADNNLYLPDGNIADQSLTIALKGMDKMAGGDVVIYDPAGRVLERHRFAPAQQEWTVPVGHWATGMYFIRYQGMVLRFVKR